eukprot:Hpha_TRINITY_DN7846_c0_g1::TRINITY_DN7846_c0_g1_i2::g.185524::m.185524
MLCGEAVLELSDEELTLHLAKGADVWSAGCIHYELAAGSKLFLADTDATYRLLMVDWMRSGPCVRAEKMGAGDIFPSGGWEQEWLLSLLSGDQHRPTAINALRTLVDTCEEEECRVLIKTYLEWHCKREGHITKADYPCVQKEVEHIDSVRWQQRPDLVRSMVETVIEDFVPKMAMRGRPRKDQ